MSSMKLFIIGIAGQTGSRVARHLFQAGDSVSGLCRRREQTAAVQQMGARAVVGDLVTLSEAGLTAAVSGADALVYTAGAGEQDDDSLIDAIDGAGVRKAIVAARAAGISKFLLVSVFPEARRGEDAPPSFEHYIKVKKRAEVDLVHSALDWLILRPSSLTNEAGTDRVNLSPAEIHTTVSRDDVAAIIVALLHAPGLSRRVLEVTAGSSRIVDAVRQLLQQ